MIDPLEPRRLLAIGSIFNGVLRIFGQDYEDYVKVDVGLTETVVTYENATQYFQTALFYSILIDAKGGNDWIRITGEFSRPATINGGGGNDTILGGQQIEWLSDGAGNDVIYYQFGDVIDPQEPGDDEFFFGTAPAVPQPTLIDGVLRITGMPFSDTIVLDVYETAYPSLMIHYHEGSDWLYTKDIQSIIVDGGGGNDRIQINPTVRIPTRVYGREGNDTVIGGSGSDRIYGGEGNDWIGGFGGNDIIYGENGNDRLLGGDGRDYIVGGAGSDVIRGESGVDHVLASMAIDDFRGNVGDLITLV